MSIPSPNCANRPDVLLFALEQESKPFLRAAPSRNDLDVRISGMGRKNAEAAITRLLAERPPRHVITAGVAGALNPDLKVGEVVFETSDLCLAGALIALGARRVTFAATEHVLVTVADRQRLRAATGADVVENESGFVQKICRARGVTCTTIRTISDTADQEMPFDFNKLTGPDGNVSYCKVIAAVLQRPWTLPAVLGLGRQMHTATANLARVLQRVVSTCGDSVPPS